MRKFMYKGKDYPMLNDLVIVEAEIAGIPEEDLTEVKFSPGDLIFYGYGAKNRQFEFTEQYEVEKCKLDCDIQILKIKGIEGYYSASMFEVPYSSNKGIGELSAAIQPLRVEYGDVDILEACEQLNAIYNEFGVKKEAPKFEAVTNEMACLYNEKNKNYGNSFSKQFEEYGLTSTCIRLDDKINRLKSLNKMDSNGTKDESVRDTLIDLANYAVLTIMELDKRDLNEN